MSIAPAQAERPDFSQLPQPFYLIELCLPHWSTRNTLTTGRCDFAAGEQLAEYGDCDFRLAAVYLEDNQ